VQPCHVYVHVPFCARRCAYCDFAIAVRGRVPVDEYVTELTAELDVRALGMPPVSVDTIYLGGGTPSRLGPDGVRRVLDVVASRFPPAVGAEITIEANPDDIDATSVREWKRAGVNRVSLGVQSFDDRVLQWMHRTHDAKTAMDAAEMLGGEGIENWSLDLIFALPGTLARDWQRDLDQAIGLRPPHLSLYGLTVEPHTPIARWRDRGLTVEGSEDIYETEYLLASSALASAGYTHYEVSNFGLPGRSSRHNRGYWTGASYVGLGPSAHGYDGNVRRWNEREYAAWARRVTVGTDPIAGAETLTDENRISEQVYLGLRTADGLLLGADEHRAVAPWVEAGWGSIEADRLRLSPTGWLRLDTLAASLAIIRSRYYS
jgi:oxygen-independent coproporphyrinogen-3 oxidase